MAIKGAGKGLAAQMQGFWQALDVWSQPGDPHCTMALQAGVETHGLLFFAVPPVFPTPPNYQ